MPSRVLTLGLVAGGLLLGGCGTSDDRDQVRAVVERFYAAVGAGDADTACAQLSDDTRQQLESQSGQTCDEVITRLDYDGGAIVETHVYSVNADAELRSGERAFLSRQADGWKLTAIGCKEQENLPRDRPYDCEAEA